MVNSKFRKYIYLAVVIVLVIVVSFVTLQISGFFRDRTPVHNTIVNVSSLQQQILSIGELATIEYNYRTLITLKDSHTIKGWAIPLTQKSYIIVVDGTMKIGIDASKVLVDADEDLKIVSITIPKAKILSHELHEDTMEVLEESSGLFNRVSIEDWATMAVNEKQSMEEKVSESDTLVRAENDTANMLQAFIEGVVPKEYSVRIKRQ